MSNYIYSAAPQFLDKFGGGNRMQFTTLAKNVYPLPVADFGRNAAHILVLGRLDKFDCNAIGDIFLTCKEKVCDIYKKGPLDDVGPDDFFAYGVPMQILAMDAVPGLMDKIQAFFDRADVKSLDFDAENGPAANAASRHPSAPPPYQRPPVERWWIRS